MALGKILDVTDASVFSGSGILPANPDGIEDATTAFQHVIDELISNSTAANAAGWGSGQMHIPKGKYLISRPLNFHGSIGLKVTGEGEYATTIIVREHNFNLINLSQFISVTFEDLTFYHQLEEGTVEEDVHSSWFNSVFKFSSGGGGARGLSLVRCTTLNFNKVLDLADEPCPPGETACPSVNGDTTTCTKCTFLNFNVFMDSDNTQAILNSFDNCSWASPYAEAIFHISGSGRTQVNTGNVVIGGTLLKFKNQINKYGPSSNWQFTNTKLEWTAMNDVAGRHAHTPKLLDADVGVEWAADNSCVLSSQYINTSVVFDNCGLSGGKAELETGLDDAATLVRLNTAGLRLVFNGGYYEGIFRLIKNTKNVLHSGNYIKFTDVHLQKTMDDWWLGHYEVEPINCGKVFVKDTLFVPSQLTYPTISFDNTLMGEGANILPLNFTWARLSYPYLQARRTSFISSPDRPLDIIQNFSATEDVILKIPYPFYGQKVLINSIKAYVRGETVKGTKNKKITVFRDANFTDRLTVPLKLNTPNSADELFTLSFETQYEDFPVVTEGLFVKVVLPKAPESQQISLRLWVDYTSI